MYFIVHCIVTLLTTILNEVSTNHIFCSRFAVFMASS